MLFLLFDLQPHSETRVSRLHAVRVGCRQMVHIKEISRVERGEKANDHTIRGRQVSGID